MIIRNNFRNNVTGNNVNTTKNTLLRKKSVFESIDANKIGEGKYFTEGSFGHRKNLGLKGQLSKIKRAGKNFVTKNISKKNLEDMYGMISNRLKKHDGGGSVHITRRDKKSIMGEAERLVRSKNSKFSREDKKDLERIVDSLKEQSKNTILRKRSNTQVSESKNNPLFRNKKRNMDSDIDFLTKSSENIQNSSKSKNVLNNNEDKKILELEEDLGIKEPSEQDDDIDHLRRQAKDLAI